jgi:hypothetical protein
MNKTSIKMMSVQSLFPKKFYGVRAYGDYKRVAEKRRKKRELENGQCRTGNGSKQTGSNTEGGCPTR